MTSTEHGLQVVHPVPPQHGDQQAPAAPAYQVPKVPEAAWSMAGCRRRTWVSRAVLLCVLVFQAVLSLRLHNTAFQDEAVYLSSGHVQIAHLLHGTPVPTDYGSYFSGSPLLYPVLAALVDARFGLGGARLLSLLFMLGANALLYAMTRRLFSERPALAASALFAVIPSTIILGNFATYDSAAVFLLALAAWIIVRTDRAPLAAVLLAAPVAVLAVATKYAAGLYLPTLVVLAALVSWPHRGRGSVVRAVLLVTGVIVPILAGLHYTDVLDGVRATTTARAHGTDGVRELLWKSTVWGGAMFLTACGGAVAYARRGRMNEAPQAARLGVPGGVWRALLGVLLCGTALLAPAYQIHLSTSVALYKHIGFGLLFAAPLAGVGLTRLVGAHFRHPQLACVVWVTMLCVGLTKSAEWFASWPDSSRLNTALRQYVKPGEGRYLAATPNVPVYYLRDITAQASWSSLYYIGYQDARGAVHHGVDGYRKALADGWFDLVVLDGVASELDGPVAAAVRSSGRYRLLATVPFGNDQQGHYRIWVKR
ncbi:glycosyltransferase family 39 protein [Streptomyces sp. NBC_00038]|uniref:ArnT family glycosyltransferase n=1 Tax=Streptomyces sp. NBC_00038 TaxID=2903615 RepID=UPI0022510A23|nr:glycosyltransferase family 39 protein [Streptomyces sp. NBC_00038]MCX5560052.1 glycosyltransferase family 39 protein [Streptomyces sp. NBC_00038]